MFCSALCVSSTPPYDSDDMEYGDCSGVGVDCTSFDSRVDRCFIISDSGSVRQVSIATVNKEVYNVMLINPLGELILLSAWQQNAVDLLTYFS